MPADSFGQRLREARERKVYSQDALASRVWPGCRGMTPMVAAWESNEKEPTKYQLVRLCNALGVSADELLGRKRG